MDDDSSVLGQVLFHPVASESLYIDIDDESIVDHQISTFSQTEVCDVSYGDKNVNMSEEFLPDIEWIKEW